MPGDHRLSPLGKRRPSGGIFLSHPHTHDVDYYILVLFWSGLAALQWKKRLGEAVQVVASQPDTSCFHGNCETNNVQVADWPIAEAHRPGEYLKCKQSEKEVYVCPENGHIAMHRESFSFV